MSDIYVYSADATDFSSFGLVGALVPTECKFTEEANGGSEIELKHPYDDFERFKALARGNILSVPVPVRTTPPITDSGAVETFVEKWVVRSSSVATAEQRKIYREVDGDSSYTTLKGGEEVTVFFKDYDKKRWKIKYSKYTGWMDPSGLDDKTEIVIGDSSSAIEEVESPWTVRPQYFRIYSVERNMDDVSVNARHISYDLLGNITMYSAPQETLTLKTVLDNVLSKCIARHSFKAFTDVGSSHSSIEFIRKNPISIFLDPEEGLVKLYKCSLVRDNFELYFLNDPGLNRGVRIQYAKNLTGITYTESIENVCTRIVPLGETQDGEKLYLVDDIEEDPTGYYIDSKYISEYPAPHIQVLECEDCTVGDEITVDIARSRMREQVQKQWDNEVDLPDITVEVEFLNLGDTEEYAQYKNLENVFLFDYVTITHPAILSPDNTTFKNGAAITGRSLLARVTAIEWDCILDRMTKLTVGTLNETLATSSVTSWQMPSGYSESKVSEMSQSISTITHAKAVDLSTAVGYTIDTASSGLYVNSIAAYLSFSINVTQVPAGTETVIGNFNTLYAPPVPAAFQAYSSNGVQALGVVSGGEIKITAVDYIETATIRGTATWLFSS